MELEAEVAKLKEQNEELEKKQVCSSSNQWPLYWSQTHVSVAKYCGYYWSSQKLLFKVKLSSIIWNISDIWLEVDIRNTWCVHISDPSNC